MGEWTKKLLLTALCLVFCTPAWSFYAETDKSKLLNYYNTTSFKLLTTHPDSAYSYISKATELAEKSKNYPQKSTALRNMGTYYLITSDFERAMEYYQKSRKIAEKADYLEGEFKALNNIGLIHMQLGDYYFALENLYASFQLKQEYNKTAAKKLNLRTSMSNIGQTYLYLEDYENAKVYLMQALQGSIEKQFLPGIINGYRRMSTLNRAQGKKEEALEYIQKALKVSEGLEPSYYIANAYLEYAIVMKSFQHWESANAFLDKAFVIYEDIENKLGKAQVYHHAAQIKLQKGDLKQAKEQLSASIELARQTEAKALIQDNFKICAELHHLLGEYEEALSDFQIAQAYQDSLFNEQSALQLKSFHLKIQEQQNNKMLASKNENIQRKQIALYALGIILVLIIILTITIISRYRLLKIHSHKLRSKSKQILLQSQKIEEQKQGLHNQNVELQRTYSIIENQNSFLEDMNCSLEKKVQLRTKKLASINQELETLIYRASHDLKSPLTSVLGLVELARLELKDKQALALFEKINQCTLSQQKILSQLFDAAQIRLTELKIDPIDLHKQITQDFRSLQRLKGFNEVAFHLEIPKGTTFYTDRLLFSTIMQRVLENAVNFRDTSKARPEVHISIDQQKDGLHFQISDNGLGIEKGLAHQAFDIFFKASNRSSGNGLGLYVAKKAVDKLRGTISLHSAIRKKTVVELWLPSLENEYMENKEELEIDILEEVGV